MAPFRPSETAVDPSAPSVLLDVRRSADGVTRDHSPRSGVDRTDDEAIAAIRAGMAAPGQPADDLTDAELRRRAHALTGGRPDALQRVARVLEEPDPDDERD
jgi:hypothetical protein